MNEGGKLLEYDIADMVPASQRRLLSDCSVVCSPAVKSRISIQLPGNALPREGYRVVVREPEFTGGLKLALGPGTGRIEISTRGPAFLDIRIWRDGTFSLGRGTTVSQARVICDDADVVVGEDGLWSDEILIQSNDQHGIVDSVTGQVINGGRRSIVIGDHVWIGRRAMVLPDVEMSSGCILAAGSILTKNTPRNTVFAGVPAREVKNKTTWSRSPAGMSEPEHVYLEAPDRFEGDTELTN